MKTSYNEFLFAQQFEGLRLKPYKDIAGNWTIGCGHLVRSTMELNLYWNGITTQHAWELFQEDVQKAEDAVNRLLKINVTQQQFDMLVDFQFNTGSLNDSTLLKMLNDGEFTQAAAQFLRWDHFYNPKDRKEDESKGLYRRCYCRMQYFGGMSIDQLKQHNWYMELVA